MEINKNKRGMVKLTPLAVSVFLALPVLAQAASVSIPGGKIVNVNGVPVININTANSNGISHNIYDQLNVDKEGLIFNNSAKDVETTLAGRIAGNANLAAGSAKIILNEVTSNNKSVIDGKMEVAGDKAHLIIANPNGITVNNSGFINTEKTTLTTGRADIKQGELKGYSVAGGTLAVKEITSDSPTEILARSVVVNGEIHADQLTVIAGNNYVNTKAQAIGTVTGSGAKNAYGIDITKVGGMYANRITLVSTESGVGVRNSGIVAGGAQGVAIDNYGHLVNIDAAITSEGALSVRTNGSLNNESGTLRGIGKISIDTITHSINNSKAGNISSLSDIDISSGEFNNSNGKTMSNGQLFINTHNKTLTNSGTANESVIQGGAVMLKTATLNNSKGRITGHSVAVESTVINNTSGAIDAINDVQLISAGNIDNSRGLIHSHQGQIEITAQKVFSNRDTLSTDVNNSAAMGVQADAGDIKIIATSINNMRGALNSTGSVIVESNSELVNVYGNISAMGNVILSSAAAIDNYSGRVHSDGTVFVDAASLDNSSWKGMLDGKKGVNIELSGMLDNSTGLIVSAEGDVAVKVKALDNMGGILSGNNIDIISASNVYNVAGLINANKKLSINALSEIDNRYGDDFTNGFGSNIDAGSLTGGIYGRDGISITARNVKNNYSSIIAEKGPLSLNVNDSIINDRGYMASLADMSIMTKSLKNNNGIIAAIGNLSIDVDTLSNTGSGSLSNNSAAGIISSAQKMDLLVKGNFTNSGWISAKGDAVISVVGKLTNNKSITADKALTIRAIDGFTNNMDIIAASDLIIDTNGSLTNAAAGKISGKVTNINVATDINNKGNVLASDELILNAGGTITNTSKMVTDGYASITAQTVNNSGNKASLGGSKGLVLEADKVIGAGTLVGL